MFMFSSLEDVIVKTYLERKVNKMENKKTRLFSSLFLIIWGMAFHVFCAQAAIITVDGDIGDWEGVPSLGTDADDITDDAVDVKAGYAASSTENLYIRFDLYGNVNRIGNTYIVYLDTDQNASTGFTAGWWMTGADYRIYIDEWNIGLQKFMGTTQGDDTWGWNGTVYALKEISIAYGGSSIESAVLRADIEETEPIVAINILWRAYPGDDSIPYYNAAPVTYYYDGAGEQDGETIVDNFEYPDTAALNAAYSVECDPSTSLALDSEGSLPYQGQYCAKLSYSLGGLWSSVKMRRDFSFAEDWSNDKKISFWMKGYSGCTENLLVYIIEEDGDEWGYQSKYLLINEAWTKVVISLSELWDNPWDGNAGDGVRTLTRVKGYKIVIQDITDNNSSPVNKCVYVDRFVRDDGAISSPHPVPDVMNYTCYYGFGRIEDLSKFDMVIIEASNYSAEDIAAIKASGTIVLGYVSLGEDTRPLQVEDGTGPISSGFLTFNGYAPYYLDDNPRDGYPDRNSVWGGYYVHAGNALWQDYVINILMKDIIETKGCDGVFFDTVDISGDSYYNWTSPGMISIVAAARRAYPSEYLITNRGFFIFADIEGYINGAMFESFTSYYDWFLTSYRKWDEEALGWTEDMADQINAVRGYPNQMSVNIFSLDYCGRADSALYTEDYNRAKSFGFISSVSDIYLSKIYMVNPANNLEASKIIVRKKINVKLTWDAPSEYILDSNVLYFVLKRSGAGPIDTDEKWANAETLSAAIAKTSVSFTDTHPPAGIVYYALGAVKVGGMELAGRIIASYQP